MSTGRFTNARPWDVDPAAVDRLIHGEPINSTGAERAEATRILTEAGYSADFIAAQLKVAERSVCRYRAAIRSNRKAA